MIKIGFSQPMHELQKTSNHGPGGIDDQRERRTIVDEEVNIDDIDDDDDDDEEYELE